MLISPEKVFIKMWSYLLLRFFNLKLSTNKMQDSELLTNEKRDVCCIRKSISMNRSLKLADDYLLM